MHCHSGDVRISMPWFQHPTYRDAVDRGVLSFDELEVLRKSLRCCLCNAEPTNAKGMYASSASYAWSKVDQTADGYCSGACKLGSSPLHEHWVPSDIGVISMDGEALPEEAKVLHQMHAHAACVKISHAALGRLRLQAAAGPPAPDAAAPTPVAVDDGIQPPPGSPPPAQVMRDPVAAQKSGQALTTRGHVAQLARMTKLQLSLDRNRILASELQAALDKRELEVKAAVDDNDASSALVHKLLGEQAETVAMLEVVRKNVLSVGFTRCMHAFHSHIIPSVCFQIS